MFLGFLNNRYILILRDGMTHPLEFIKGLVVDASQVN